MNAKGFTPTTIYVGYDNREDIAYQVCRSSLLSYSTSLRSEDIVPLKHQDLRTRKIFWREWRVDHSGQYWDDVDGRPFSTEFSFTRFLVPELARKQGITEGPVIFVDCDFLFMNDIQQLIRDHFDPSKAVQVVKHNYKPTNTVKMDNKIQVTYSMKLWSSFMIFNMGHPENNKLDLATANTASGSFLHGFGWLSSPDLIGDIPPEWNVIGDKSENVKPSAVHYTEGGPWFRDYENCPFSKEWYQQLNVAFEEDHYKVLEW